MPINTVSVVAPRAQAERQEKPKKDAMQQILEGLQIANGILGIGNNVQSIRDHQGNIEKNEYALEKAKTDAIDESRGLRTPAQLAELQKTHDLSDSPLRGSVRLMKREDGKESAVYSSFREKAKTPLQRSVSSSGMTVQGGKTGKLTKYNDGTTDFIEAPPEKPGKPPKDITVQERNTLQNQYDRDPSVRRAKAVIDSWADAQELVKDKSGAADHSLIVRYFKSIDPGSVVKETEAETVQALGGIEQRASAWMKKNITGDAGLTDGQRADILAQIRKAAQTATAQQSKIDKQFVDLAGRRGVDPMDLRFTNLPTFEDPQKPAQTQGFGEANAASGGESVPAVTPAEDAAAKAWATTNRDSPDPETRRKAEAILQSLPQEPKFRTPPGLREGNRG